MSTPDPASPPPADLEATSPTPGHGWLPVAQPRPPAPLTRTARACNWVGWHFGELAGVGIPLIPALWWPWCALVSGIVVALWLALEHRARHRKDTTGGEQ